MTLTALLVCGDKAAAEVLRRVLEELSIGVEPCPDFSRAAFRLAQERFDVVIVDGASHEDVVALLRETRASRMNDSTLAVAVVSNQDAIREIFSMGVNFVLYKPVTYDRALSSLRAARAVMRKEKRKSARAAVHTHATIDYANVQHEKATLVNLAVDGMSVRFGKKLPPTSKVYFQFKLPGQVSTVRLSGLVIWQDWNGRAGVHFVDVPKSSRRLLEEFLEANLPTDIRQDQLPDVTVEVQELDIPGITGPGTPKAHSVEIEGIEIEEEPLQPVGAGKNPKDGGHDDGGRRHGDGKRGEGKHEGKHSEAAKSSHHAAREIMPLEAEKLRAAANADRDNRRTQTRHACRLGAEVYRTGKTVPNHCCLTDLSSGGCYLEVSLPFPSASTVEIVVRTYEMKLRLRGTVQASHPGYGMGVVFDLSAKEQQENVKKLLDFVAGQNGK